MKTAVFGFFLFTKVFCGTNTPLADCDPMKGRFHQGNHHVPAEFLSENGHWDNQAWFEYKRREQRFEPSLECINLPLETSLEENLRQIENQIDMRR